MKLYLIKQSYMVEEHFEVEANSEDEAIDIMNEFECVFHRMHQLDIDSIELLEDEYAIGENPND